MESLISYVRRKSGLAKILLCRLEQIIAMILNGEI